MSKSIHPLARIRIKSFLLRFLNHLRVELEIHALEKSGKRADPRSVVSRILALVEQILEKDLDSSE